jgi:hypothetical protein
MVVKKIVEVDIGIDDSGRFIRFGDSYLCSNLKCERCGSCFRSLLTPLHPLPEEKQCTQNSK